MKASFARFLRALPLLILAPFLLTIGALALAATDLAWLIAGRRRKPADTRPEVRAASLVIPNWNGKDLLQRFLPSWLPRWSMQRFWISLFRRERDDRSGHQAKPGFW